MEGLLSVKETAKQLACSEAMLRKWMHQGKLPYVKVGRLPHVLFYRITLWTLRNGATRGKLRYGFWRKERD